MFIAFEACSVRSSNSMVALRYRWRASFHSSMQPAGILLSTSGRLEEMVDRRRSVNPNFDSALLAELCPNTPLVFFQFFIFVNFINCIIVKMST